MARIGLVLGAGGVVGQAWHAGVLAALAEVTGWDPRRAEIVVGTSAGSGIGATLRRGVSAADLLARAMDGPLSASGRRLLAGMPPPSPPPRTPRPGGRRGPAGPGALARAAMAPWRTRPGVLAAAVLPPGRVAIDGIGAAMRSLYGPLRWPEEPLWICAVRLDTGARVVFGRDGGTTVDIGTAVQASCAIPGVFAPVEIDGVSYVDGGAHSPTNLDLLAREGLDLIVVSSPMSTADGAVDRRTALRAVTSLQLAAEVRTARRRGTAVLAFQPTRADLDVMGWNAMDFGRRSSVARQALASATRRLAHPRATSRVDLLRG